MAVPSSGPRGTRAVAIAERYLGVPYLWGGADPISGFDCSGLAMYVYAQLGVDLTHYTGAQWYEGTRVPPSQLEPGDLVFFEPSSRGPQHEGIYIGNGQFIQAPHTGDVVKISSLDQPSYRFGYVGAVRPWTG
jgi:cell wall-associated NlpC family hydrolase